MEFLDPTHEQVVARRTLAPRLANLTGATVGVISNGKESTVPFFDQMTTAFVSAAEVMARALGEPGYGFVVIEHPISSADEAGLRARAVTAVDQAAVLLLGG